jgi:hypothetical protein
MSDMRSLVLLIAVCSCASGGSTAQSGLVGDKQTTMFTSDGTGTLRTEAVTAATATIAAPPEAVWTAVKQFYAGFEIPLSFEDRTVHHLGNQNFYKSREMGGHPMATWVNCGSGLTGDAAATDRIFMTSVTEVLPDGSGGTKLKTTFVATAQDLSQGSSYRIACASTGRFEQALSDQVKKSLGK